MVEHVARHLANRAELLKALDDKKAEWAQQDAVREIGRTEVLAAFEQGLKDVDAVIVEAGGEVPVADATDHATEEHDPSPAA